MATVTESGRQAGVSSGTDQGDPVMAARASGLTKIYGQGNTRVTALDDIDIGFEAGKLTAIMGPSGSGKSTLLHCMAGLDTVTAGEVRIGGTVISTLSDKELTLLRRERLGFIFQSFNLVPTLTAEENILLPLLLGGRKADVAWETEVISSLGMSERLGHRPDELSGGQQQRVAVARALVSRPDLIFADEPTGNLDSNSGQEVLGFLRRAVDDWHQTVVMVTHDPVAASYADIVLFLRDGQFVGQLTSPTPDLVLDRIRELEV
jgi:putative ABC transport system ATP-binding protein